MSLVNWTHRSLEMFYRLEPITITNNLIKKNKKHFDLKSLKPLSAVGEYWASEYFA